MTELEPKSIDLASKAIQTKNVSNELQKQEAAIKVLEEKQISTSEGVSSTLKKSKIENSPIYVGTSEWGKQVEEKKESEVLMDILNNLASKKFKKDSFKSLSLDQKLVTLGVAVDEKQEGSAVVKNALEQIRIILQSPPEKDHIKQLEIEFGKLPNPEDFYGNLAEVERRFRHEVFQEVALKKNEYEMNDIELSQFALKIGETSVGGVTVSSNFDILGGISLSDQDLAEYVYEQQVMFDVNDFQQSDLSEVDQEIDFLKKMQQDLIKKTTDKKKPFDANEVKSIVGNIKKRIARLNSEEKSAIQELKSFKPNTGEQLAERIDEERSIRNIKPEHLKQAYENLPSDDERKEFLAAAVRQIREDVSQLEDGSEPWELRASLDPTILDLNSWLLFMRAVDQEKFDEIKLEVESRQWLHNLYRTLRRGASPTETKELLHRMQDFDEVGMYQSLAKIDGFAEAFQLWEARAKEIIAAETDPKRRKKIIESIESELEKRNVCKTDKTGITAKTAVLLAERHYKETGRDAAKYREYIRENNLIEIVEEDGVLKYYVDAHTPILWDPYRLLYCPEVMWMFFQFGANMEGSQKTVKLHGRDTKVFVAQGVGPEVLKKLKEHGFDLCLSDFYSRRKGYMSTAWIDEYLEQESTVRNDKVNPFDTTLQEDKDIWFKNLGKYKDKDERKMYALMRKGVEFKYQVLFAEQNNLPIGGSSLEEKDLKFLEGVKNRFPAQVKLINRIIQDHERALTAKNSHPYKMDGNFVSNLSEFNLKNIQWDRLARQHEVVRSNFRDHFAGLEVFKQIGDFINNPSYDNFIKLDPGAMKAYTAYADAQIRFMMPAYLAFCDVQRGKGITGMEHFGLDIFKSKYAKVYDTVSLTDLDLYKTGKLMVTQGKMSRDLLYNVRGRFPGLFYDKGLEHYDPVSVMILCMAVFEEERKKMQKDMEKL